MIETNLTVSRTDGSPNWMRVVNYLTRDASARRGGLAMDELRGLACLAAPKARANYRPDKAKCSLRRWVYRWGKRLLSAEIRNELARRRRSVHAVSFTDLGACSAFGAADGCLEARFVCGHARPHQRMELIEMLQAFSPISRHIVLLRAQNWTLGQIGHQVGLTGEAVRLRLVRIGIILQRRKGCSV